MGALYLKSLDQEMEKIEKEGIEYVRYMDDWVIKAPTRWKLRKAVKVVNQILKELKVEKHLNKTYIGKKQKGFTFLGYFMTPKKIEPDKETLQRHLVKLNRLYEQGGTAAGEYQKRWLSWFKGGLSEFEHLIVPKEGNLKFPSQSFWCPPSG